ncbi:MAG TPA: inositol monophosphatase family protein [Candidatus Limnocylindrales bacterium]|nr:inositol monophosphatase family protein [Candidatus Limnocylindrales bacterium]
MRSQRPPREGQGALPALTRGATERYARLARLAEKITVSVGNAIVTNDVDVVTRKRGRANFATAADHAAEKAIIAALREHDDSVPVLAEESARRGLRESERLWVVDPIDGTLNFSRGIPFYAVVIAYVEDGRARAAAVHAPRTKETFVASEGRGATRNGKAIRVSDTRRLSQALATASLSYRVMRGAKPKMPRLASACAGMRDVGSAALGMTYVADGRFDLFAHQFLSPWDTAGPSFIAREAGAAVLSLKSGADASWHESQVIIANPALAKAALALLERR